MSHQSQTGHHCAVLGVCTACNVVEVMLNLSLEI